MSGYLLKRCPPKSLPGTHRASRARRTNVETFVLQHLISVPRLSKLSKRDTCHKAQKHGQLLGRELMAGIDTEALGVVPLSNTVEF